MAGKGIVIVAFLYLASCLLVQTHGQNASTSGLRIGFYNLTCPLAESLVQQTVAQFFKDDQTVPAALLRMFFHDCFVLGCDASITIVSNSTNDAEKDAGPNLTVRGFDLINTAKTSVENACRGVVSCADIIALATRDAVVLAKGPHWDVPTGRRDGTISLLANAENLPDPSDTSQQGIAAFAAKGLSQHDFVTLLGAHTVGISHCRFFDDRLYDFQGSGKPDPTMNPNLVKSLRKTCPDPSKPIFKNPGVFLDQGTPFIFDNNYYKELLSRNGILRIDQQVGADKSLSGTVKKFASSSSNFNASFVASMINLGNVGVKTGSEGEIRLSCSVVNS
ncbi:hypothetical protein O6H91_11G057200 [Diphasiastrum complanatum]|uniref:Uncharacterized protein n=2 Tax=Diphasiastrum complanatum TaxID=34168 RepID=A0ACC2C9M9_DIPCM|nr:hypothetical protein O6H91_11G057200 [Diphasiastrum complanatum]KAJ7538627.1 hypothetical protein O6H91_11G057200 [Diphasiastrum complanatum]